MAVEQVGDPIIKNIIRTEEDTDDIVLELTNPDGTEADVVDWTAELSVGQDAETPLSPEKTYTGTGVAGGLIAINMNGFDIPQGSYKYNVRLTDTVTGDQPARVYWKGNFKVTPLI